MYGINKLGLLLACLLCTNIFGAAKASAENEIFNKVVERVHFLIPGGAGGGWDNTARSVGETLRRAGLANTVSYENLSGGGGGRAIARLIETAEHQHHTLMVNSTPIVIRSLRQVFPQSFRDLTPISTVIVDYPAFVVTNDSSFKNWHQVIEAFKQKRRNVLMGGGSTRGSMDHLVGALAIKAAGGNPRDLIYVPYNAGGKAMAGLLSREINVLSTGLSEALEMQKAGQVNILAITADRYIEELKHIPTLKGMGYDAVFANWRGFFGPPGIPQEKVNAHIEMFTNMYTTQSWQEIRQRNGWVNMRKSGNDFHLFLQDQESILRDLMSELGFLYTDS